MARILVVDDDSQSVEQAARLITESGHTAEFLLESHYLIPKMESDPAELILLDINMPGEDGLTLLRRLKEREGIREVPVIMITGETDERLIAESFDLGAVDFVNKPVRPLELKSRIRIALETREHILAIQRQSTALRRAKAFTDAILDTIEDAIFVVDARDHRIVEVNRAFLARTGLSREEALGRVFFTEKNPDRHHDAFLCNTRHEVQVLQSETVRSASGEIREFHCRDPDGKNSYTRVVTLPIHSGGAGAQGADRTLFLARDITESKLAEEHLRHLAFHDALTGLPNRQLFRDRLDQALAQSRRHNQMVAVMYFDLDRFKEVNDTLGHAVGDLLLQDVARRLTANVRESDTVARLGGDEFTAVLTNVESVAQVRKVARKILKALSRGFDFGEHQVTVTSSIGISLFPRDGDDWTVLTKRADKALYKAKEAGRDNVQFYGAYRKPRRSA